jgi:hypothetical protein
MLPADVSIITGAALFVNINRYGLQEKAEIILIFNNIRYNKITCPPTVIRTNNLSWP